eukprot:TRINITY_DN39319_c0_g1_i1.p1 TRINITY_DN39319_c0_g1~~TRINITY_DN39319_c0_g1_i1.p1  ORF type:complete len:498 (+),score=169.56 TRINITY_DN39319_c0_g1_i1:63-1496(+)
MSRQPIAVRDRVHLGGFFGRHGTVLACEGRSVLVAVDPKRDDVDGAEPERLTLADVQRVGRHMWVPGSLRDLVSHAKPLHLEYRQPPLQTPTLEEELDGLWAESLPEFSLSNNALLSFPPSVLGMKALKVLRLSHNYLAELPDEICDLPLTVLTAEYNDLVSLPSRLPLLLPTIRELRVGGNPRLGLSAGQLRRGIPAVCTAAEQRGLYTQLLEFVAERTEEWLRLRVEAEAEMASLRACAVHERAALQAAVCARDACVAAEADLRASAELSEGAARALLSAGRAADINKLERARVDEDAALLRGCTPGGPDRVVSLNVGGRVYQARASTLRRGDPMPARYADQQLQHRRTVLASLLEGDDVLTDGDGRVFVDRCGRHFEYVLQWLRDGDEAVRDFPSDVLGGVQREARYFRLPALAAAASAALADLTAKARTERTIAAVSGLGTLSDLHRQGRLPDELYEHARESIASGLSRAAGL